MASRSVSKTTIRVISALKVEIIIVDDIAMPLNDNSNKEVPWFQSGYTKLNLWNLTQFKKLVYIDSDCVVLEAIDEVIVRPRILHSFSQALRHFPLPIVI